MNLPSAWDNTPISVFDGFVSSADFVLTAQRRRAPELDPSPISASSAQVYRFMFGRFVAWMLTEGLQMSAVTGADLMRFVTRSTEGRRDLNSEIALRYLRLLERCFDHMGAGINPARQALIAIDRRDQAVNDAPPLALSLEQLGRFLDTVLAERPRRRRPLPFDGWKHRRNRALLLVMALGGLRVAETIGLLLEEVDRQATTDGSVVLHITPAHKHATSYEHDATMLPGGADELAAWLREREQMRMPGSLVFPAGLDGAPLHKTTVYRLVRSTFERAGLDVARLGGRTLRNTYAVKRLREGVPSGYLKEDLGLALERSAESYSYVRVDRTGEPE